MRRSGPRRLGLRHAVLPFDFIFTIKPLNELVFGSAYFTNKPSSDGRSRY